VTTAALAVAVSWVLLKLALIINWRLRRLKQRPDEVGAVRWPDGEVVEMHRNGNGKSAQDAVDINKGEAHDG
jgi:hypothetical protein